MRFGDLDLLEQDKLEIVKQQEIEKQKIFDSKIIPHKNHTLFEVDLKNNNIEIAKFDELPAVKYTDALKGNISASKKVTKKENCIYISALNKKNVIKILKRDYSINLKNR